MKRLILLLTICTMVLLPLSAMADVLGPVPSNVVRSSANAGEIDVGGNWAEKTFTFEWDITQPGGAGNPFYYVYTVTNPTGRQTPDTSHWIMQVTPDTFAFYGDITAETGTFSPNPPEAARTFSPSDPGNSSPGLPGDIFGVKFDNTTPVGGVLKFAFYSYNQPVWGNFYAKGGNDSYAYNAGFTVPPVAGGPFTGYVLVPDSVGAPIPGSVLLLGSGILGLIGLRRKL